MMMMMEEEEEARGQTNLKTQKIEVIAIIPGTTLKGETEDAIEGEVAKAYRG